MTTRPFALAALAALLALPGCVREADDEAVDAAAADANPARDARTTIDHSLPDAHIDDANPPPDAAPDVAPDALIERFDAEPDIDALIEPDIDMTIPDAAPEPFDAAPERFDAEPERFDAAPERFDAEPERFDAAPEDLDAWPDPIDAQPEPIDAGGHTIDADYPDPECPPEGQADRCRTGCLFLATCADDHCRAAADRADELVRGCVALCDETPALADAICEQGGCHDAIESARELYPDFDALCRGDLPGVGPGCGRDPCDDACAWTAACAERDCDPAIDPATADEIYDDCRLSCAAQPVLSNLICAHRTCGETLDLLRSVTADFAAICGEGPADPDR